MEPKEYFEALKDNDQWTTELIPRSSARVRASRWRSVIFPSIAVGAAVAMLIFGVQALRGNSNGSDGSSFAPVASQHPTTLSSFTTPSPSGTEIPSEIASGSGTSHEPTKTGSQLAPAFKIAATAANPSGLPSLHDYATYSQGPANNFGFLFGFDLGSVPTASGTVTTDADGHPVAYQVAEGDTWAQVSLRFDIPNLWNFNCARRAKPFKLYTGDVLNLSPYTIATVGSENGSSKPASASALKECLSQTGIPTQF